MQNGQLGHREGSLVADEPKVALVAIVNSQAVGFALQHTVAHSMAAKDHAW